MLNAEEIDTNTLTLLLKYGKHVVLIFAQPLTTFKTIKTDLLAILHERYPDGIPTSLSPTPTKIPDSVQEVALGVPKDVYDLSKGWEEINTNEEGNMECPRSLGVKDGAQIAFAFVSEGEEVDGDIFHVEFSNVDELYPEDG